MPDAPHGTLSRYQHRRCRCEPCRHAKARHYRLYCYAKTRGDYDKTLTSTAPAAAHIQRLQRSGMTLKQIASASGNSYTVIQRMSTGARPTGYARNVAAVLNVQPTSRHDYTPIGIIRRLQGLYSAGWDPYRIAAEAGLPRSTISRVVAGKNITYLWTATAEGILRATRSLSRLSPPRKPDGTLKASYGQQAQDRARREGWVSLMVWDDIDDPDEQPNVQPARTRLAVDEELVARVWRLRGQGWTDQAIADVIGYRTASAVCKLRQRHPNPQED